MTTNIKPHLQQAIDHLTRCGFVVTKHAKLPLYDIRRHGSKQYCHSNKYVERRSYIRDTTRYKAKEYPYCWTERGVIKFASDVSSNNRRRTAVRRDVKQDSKAKNRTASRNLLKQTDLDKIDDRSSINHAIKTGDRWDWD